MPFTASYLITLVLADIKLASEVQSGGFQSKPSRSASNSSSKEGEPPATLAWGLISQMYAGRLPMGSVTADLQNLQILSRLRGLFYLLHTPLLLLQMGRVMVRQHHLKNTATDF